MKEKIKRHLLAYAPLEDFYVLSPPSGDDKNSLVGFFSKGDPFLLVIDDDEIAEHVNTHECKHLSPLLEGLTEGTTVYADKGYDSAENRQHLKEHQLLDGIMRKAHRNRPLTEVQTKRNRYLSKTRYVVEQSFGTLHRKFRYARAAYFGLCKVSAQSHLKAMCLNLLKAANRLSMPVAA